MIYLWPIYPKKCITQKKLPHILNDFAKKVNRLSEKPLFSSLKQDMTPKTCGSLHLNCSGAIFFTDPFQYSME
jgi:hypothetical protein